MLIALAAVRPQHVLRNQSHGRAYVSAAKRKANLSSLSEFSLNSFQRCNNVGRDAVVIAKQRIRVISRWSQDCNPLRSVTKWQRLILILEQYERLFRRFQRYLLMSW